MTLYTDLSGYYDLIVVCPISYNLPSPSNSTHRTQQIFGKPAEQRHVRFGLIGSNRVTPSHYYLIKDWLQWQAADINKPMPRPAQALVALRNAHNYELQWLKMCDF